MKVILYMATTTNGMIAKSDDSASFITEAESKSYVSMVLDAGALIVGRRTYEILSKQPEWKEFCDAKISVIVVSRSPLQHIEPKDWTAHSPKEALEQLHNTEKVIVAGGGSLNSAFLAENLVDEIYLDIEPAVLGKGIPLFDGLNFERSLELLGTKHLSDNEIQLHYKVVK